MERLRPRRCAAEERNQTGEGIRPYRRYWVRQLNLARVRDSSGWIVTERGNGLMKATRSWKRPMFLYLGAADLALAL